MAKFSIAFISFDNQKPLRHRIIESAVQDAALKVFFEDELSDFYSDDATGFSYFKEDFFDTNTRGGSIIELD